MHQLTRILTATALLSAVAAPLSAQSNAFLPGVAYDSPALTGFATTGNDMQGMLVTWRWIDGTSAQSAWSNTGGTCGVTSAEFSVSVGCGTDTFGGAWTVTNSSRSNTLMSVEFNGAPGKTLFDCDWNGFGCENVGSLAGVVGTAGSANGWSHQTIGGTFADEALGLYTNRVGVAGAAPVGDLFEKFLIDFGAFGMGPGQDYLFIADTDNSDFDSPPPVAVPEPTTFAMLFAGFAGFAGALRRRRRNA